MSDTRGDAGSNPARRSVFLSYARKTSRDAVRRLYEALGGDAGSAFLDETDIEAGGQIPVGVLDGLLDASVFVAFVDQTYFERWYCLRELLAALCPHGHLVRAGRPEAERTAALDGIVVVLPPAGSRSDAGALTARLPPRLRTTNWLDVGQVDKLADLIRARLAAGPPTLRQRLERLGALDALSATLTGAARVPPPRRVGPELHIHPEGSLRPSLGDGFVGRADELWQILTELDTVRTDAEAESTVFLHGGAGLGKTTMAVEFVRRCAPGHFPGGVFWLNAALEGQRELQLHGVLSTLKPDVPGLRAFRDAGRDVLAELAGALRDPSLRRILLVLDNVPEPAPNEPPPRLADWCPAIGDVALLVTSRMDVSAGRPAMRVVPLRPLQAVDAVHLLTRDVERSGLGDRRWSEVVEWVGRLPLALELLNATLRLGGLSPEELSQVVADSGPTVVLDRRAHDLEDKLDPRLPGVTEAFGLSYERLTSEQQRAARLLAFLAPEPIPVALVRSLGESAISTSTRMALTQRSFVTRVESGNVEVYGQVHRLLGDFLRLQAEDSESELVEVALALLPLMDPTQEPGRWPEMDLCSPHAELVSKRLEDARTPRGQQVCVVLRTYVGEHAAQRGDLDAAQAHEHAAFELSRALLGERHEKTLYAMNQLAWLLRECGQPQRARELLERVLAAREAELGPNHPDTARAINDLGVVLQDLGLLTEAEAHIRHGLDIRRSVLGPDDPLTAQSLNNLGILLRAMGDLDGARPLMEQALRARQRSLGAEHSSTISSLNDLGSLLAALGELAQARSLLEGSVRAAERVFGEGHLEVTTPLNNLGGLLYDLRERAGARACHERCLAIRERVLGPEHPETARSAANLGVTLDALGERADAIPLLERALATRRRLFGDEHPETAWSKVQLATVLANDVDLERARELQEQALQVRTRLHGPTHPDTVQSLNNLGVLLISSGDPEGAVAHLQMALQTRLEVLGPDHQDTAQSHHNLGVALFKAHRFAEAKEPLSRAAEIRQRVFGEDHLALAETFYDLANAHFRLDELAEARRCNERCLEIRERRLGPDHLLTADVLHNLGVVLHAAGDLGEARMCLERALEVRERRLAPDDLGTTCTLMNLGLLLGDQGDPHGRQLVERVIESRVRTLGAGHRETVHSRLLLGKLLFQRGDLDAALHCFERALADALGPDCPDELVVAGCHHNVGVARCKLRDHEGAVRHLREAVAIRERRLGAAHPDTELSRTNLRSAEEGGG